MAKILKFKIQEGGGKLEGDIVPSEVSYLSDYIRKKSDNLIEKCYNRIVENASFDLIDKICKVGIDRFLDDYDLGLHYNKLRKDVNSIHKIMLEKAYGIIDTLEIVANDYGINITDEYILDSIEDQLKDFSINVYEYLVDIYSSGEICNHSNY